MIWMIESINVMLINTRLAILLIFSGSGKNTVIKIILKINNGQDRANKTDASVATASVIKT